MKKRTFFSIILIACCIFAVSLIGGANYLLNYALKPGDRSRNEALAWHEIDSLYPGMIQWRDSLQTAHALKDTTIITPRQDTLHAWYIAAPQPTATTAVLVHGYTDCAIRMMPLGRMYNRQLNTNILLPDLYNAGRSSGNHFQMGWNDRLDIKQWTKLVVPQLFGDSARIVVHGVSMGAATTMMLSGDKDVSPSVMAYIEDCGYTSVAEQFSKELKEQFNLPQWPLIPLASQLCQFAYGWNFYQASSLKQVKLCTRPMLFIHGSADAFVPTSMVYPLYKAKPHPKELWIAPNAPHAKSYLYHPQNYTRKVEIFLRKYKVLK